MTEFDPFATTETPKTEEKNVTVEKSTEGKIVVTLKGGAGFDAPWVVVHAGDVAEATEILNDASMKELMERTKAVGSFFSGGSGSAPRPAAAPAAPQQNTAPQKHAPGNETRQCKHGEMVFREGFSEAKQKAWQGFFCPTPKGTPDQCKAQFLR